RFSSSSRTVAPVSVAAPLDTVPRMVAARDTPWQRKNAMKATNATEYTLLVRNMQSLLLQDVTQPRRLANGAAGGKRPTPSGPRARGSGAPAIGTTTGGQRHVERARNCDA